MIKALFASAAVMCAATSVSAASLDFSALSGFQGTDELVLSNATISTAADDIYIFSAGEGTNAPGANGGFCGVTGMKCDFDSEIRFAETIKDLTFTSNQWHWSDLATASIFSGTTLLGSIDIVSDMLVDFTGFSGITSLQIDDKSEFGYGMAYGDFLFELDSGPTIVDPGPDNNASPVPLPAPLALLGAGLVALFGVRRRQV